MKIVKFKEVNSNYAKDQPEYNTLPAHRTVDGQVTSCWKLSFLERLQVLITGRVYFTLMTFNNPLQPQRASIKFELTSLNFTIFIFIYF